MSICNYKVMMSSILNSVYAPLMLCCVLFSYSGLRLSIWTVKSKPWLPLGGHLASLSVSNSHTEQRGFGMAEVNSCLS